MIICFAGTKYFNHLNNQRKYYDYYAIRKIDEQYGNYEYVDQDQEQLQNYQYDNYKAESESQQTELQDINNLFPEFDKFMSFLK